MATEILNKLKEAYSEDADVQAQIIDSLLTERAYDQAHMWIKEAIARFPKNLRFYQLYARYYREQKRPYDAIGCLKQGLSIQSEHLDFVFSLAELYQEIGQYSDAILYYEKAIKLAPADQSLQQGLKRALQLKFQKDRK
jgi:tetratricopeptide (TPR) repeat protein